eukprot:XP_001710181.1 Hypothetical protein GL50803_32230 [Giardia lamblia ATCC 50803]
MNVKRLTMVTILFYTNNLSRDLVAGEAILGLRWKKKGLYGGDGHVLDFPVILYRDLEDVIPSRSVVTDKHRSHNNLQAVCIQLRFLLRHAHWSKLFYNPCNFI